MKYSLYILSSVFVLFTSSGFAQLTSVLKPIDFFNLEYVSDPQISPDGSRIVYVRNFKDIMTDRNLSNLWIVDVDGTGNRPLTTGNNNDHHPRWSSDGERIIFKSNREDDKMKFYLMWIDSREYMPLTNSLQSPNNVSWSHDGSHVAFTMHVPAKKENPLKMPDKPEGAKWSEPPIYIDDMNYRADGQGYVKAGNDQIFTLPVEGGTPRQLTFSNHDHGAPQWSSDDKYLIFSANLHRDHEYEPRNSEIYKLSVETGRIDTLTSRFGPDSGPEVSPDGRTIAYTGFDDRFQGYQLSELYLMDLDGGNQRLLSDKIDRDIQNIQWSADGDRIYFQYDESGETKIGFLTLQKEFSTVAGDLGGLSLGRPYNAASFSVGGDYRIAFTLGTVAHPADLGIISDGQVRRITNINEDLFSFKKLGKVEEINWESSYDQRQIQGWIVKPPDFDSTRQYPLILEIHGGPFASYGSVFSAEIQMFAAAGYVVFYANPRGSTGYGEEFGNLIHHDYPNHDYEDLMSGVDAVVEKGFVDTANLFVTGGSGGGVLTAWIVGKTDRFSAAVVAKPVINWYSFVLYADAPAFFYRYWFPNKPWEDPSSYLRRSPLSYVGEVTTPTMLLTGEEDYRTPIAESEQFYSALKLEKVESAMVRIPGASHGIANKPSNLVAKVVSILSWFEKYRD